MNRAQEFLGGELAKIQDKNIRDFTEYVLNNAPAYFWVVGSSSTKKHHPEQSNRNPLGLVNHTRAAIYFSESLCRAYNVEGKDKDLVIAAIATHDLLKYSQPMQRWTTKDHSTEAANFIHNLSKTYTGEIDKEDVMQICSAVAWHMGRWEQKSSKKPFPEGYNIIELLTHLSDMVSSNKEVRLEFLDEDSLIG